MAMTSKWQRSGPLDFIISKGNSELMAEDFVFSFILYMVYDKVTNF